MGKSDPRGLEESLIKNRVLQSMQESKPKEQILIQGKLPMESCGARHYVINLYLELLHIHHNISLYKISIIIFYIL